MSRRKSLLKEMMGIFRKNEGIRYENKLIIGVQCLCKVVNSRVRLCFS
jgi:hypothetical protein